MVCPLWLGSCEALSLISSSSRLRHIVPASIRTGRVTGPCQNSSLHKAPWGEVRGGHFGSLAMLEELGITWHQRFGRFQRARSQGGSNTDYFSVLSYIVLGISPCWTNKGSLSYLIYCEFKVDFRNITIGISFIRCAFSFISFGLFFLQMSTFSWR